MAMTINTLSTDGVSGKVGVPQSEIVRASDGYYLKLWYNDTVDRYVVSKSSDGSTWTGLDGTGTYTDFESAKGTGVCIAIDTGTDKIVIAYRDSNVVYTKLGTRTGNNWSLAARVSVDSTQQNYACDVMFIGTKFYLVYDQTNQSTTVHNLYIRDSSDGSTWGAATQVDTSTGNTAREYFAILGERASGKPMVVWFHRNTTSRSIFSREYGASSWNAEKTVDSGTVENTDRVFGFGGNDTDGKMVVAYKLTDGKVYTRTISTGAWSAATDMGTLSTPVISTTTGVCRLFTRTPGATDYIKYKDIDMGTLSWDGSWTTLVSDGSNNLNGMSSCHQSEHDYMLFGYTVDDGADPCTVKFCYEDIGGAAETVTLDEPFASGGGSYEQHTAETVSGDTTGLTPGSDTIDLHYSDDGGTDGYPHVITTGLTIAGDGTWSHSWVFGSIATGTEYRVRAFKTGDNTVKDESDANFSITERSIDITTPVAHVDQGIGKSKTIAGNTVGSISTVKLQYRVAAGAWNDLKTNITVTGNPGTFSDSYTVPDVESDEIDLRVVDEGGSGSCKDEITFYLEWYKVTITLPVITTEWEEAVEHNITYTCGQAFAGGVNVEGFYNIAGAGWVSFGTFVNDGTIPWTPPASTHSTNVLVRVTESSADAISDDSAQFTVYDKDYRAKKLYCYFSAVTTGPNKEVLVELSEPTIEYDDFQNDGGDIRFYDDQAQLCTHFIEEWNPGGKTFIWVTVPTSGAKYLKMEYDNDWADNGFVAYTGDMYFWAKAALGGAYEKVTGHDDEFIKPAVSYGGTGGGTTHTHTGEDGSVNTNPNTARDSTVGGSEEFVAISTHDHLFGDDISDEYPQPPYIDTMLYKMTNGQVPALLDDNAICMFAGDPGAGWTRESALDDKFLRIATAYGGPGGSNQHTHTLGLSYLNTGLSVRDGDITHTAAGIHQHDHGTSLLNAYCEVEYGHYTLCMYVPVGKDMVADFIGMFSELPPKGWTRQSAYDDKYIMGHATAGTNVAADLVHTHEYPSNTQTASEGTIYYNGGVPQAGYYLPEGGVHYQGGSLTGNASADDILHLDMIFGKRNTPDVSIVHYQATLISFVIVRPVQNDVYFWSISGVIDWTTTNKRAGGTVDIDLSKDSGSTFPTNIESDLADDGDHDWTPVEADKTETGAIRIRDALCVTIFVISEHPVYVLDPLYPMDLTQMKATRVRL